MSSDDAGMPWHEPAGPGTDNEAFDDYGRTDPSPARTARRVLTRLGALALVLALVIGGGIWFLTYRYTGNVDRIGDVFADIEEGSRPAPATPERAASAEPVTFLLVGSDTRGKASAGEDPDGRSDAIMIVRFSADRQRAQLISIPRDSWVDIPGYGMNKINASYAFDGPSLLVQTVEQLTQVRIDHYAAIDFDGLIQVTDDLSGVDVTVAETTSNGGYTFTNPPRLDAALLAVTDVVSIDDSLSDTDLLQLAYSLRSVTPADIQFFTAPVLGTGMEGAASVVYLDQVTGERMWSYLRTDSLGPNAAEFADEALPDVPR